MAPLRPFIVFIWIALPTVMFGGASLLALIGAEKLSAFEYQFFRAGHAHAGVLLIYSLAYCYYLAQTTLGAGLKRTAVGALLAGVLLQSGGFFLHMLAGAEGQWSIGNTVSLIGGVTLASATVVLVYALVKRWHPA